MIVGISGLAGSGKDTAADYLVEFHSFAKVALADPLKRILKEVYNFSDLQLWGPSQNRNAPDKRYVRSTQARHDWQEDPVDFRQWRCTACMLRGDEAGPECVVYLTPRHALQQLGTEWGRGCYQNTWVDYGLRVSRDLLAASESMTGARYTPKKGLHYPKTAETRAYKGVVIPDVRFRNELEAFKKAGAKLIRITRPSTSLSGAASAHESEQEQLQIPDSEFDAVISNDTSVEALHVGLHAILQGWL